MKKQPIYFILLMLLLADLGYSFAQHLSQPLDGDMAGIIIPDKDNEQVLTSPLGLETIVHNQTYVNPNRFFCHYPMKKYFDNTPVFLQHFFPTIDSIYLSAALIKIIIQILLIFLLAMAITGTYNFLKPDFMIAAVLVAPFFQTNGYQSYMGIIDTSPTYTFFYALPVTFLLLYFTPFFRQYYHQKKTSFQLLIYVLWIPFAIVVCLSGPLNPGVILIASVLLLLNKIFKNYSQSDQIHFIKRISASIYKIPVNYWFYLLPVSLLSLYSLYIGRYNSNNISISLIESYSRLPMGIYYPVTTKLGFPLLFMGIALNLTLIYKFFKTEVGKKILNISKWIGIFALIYILLLPLGGFRAARPNIIRYDTIMPITLSLIFIFGISALFLFKNFHSKQKRWYIPIICGILLIFTISDKPDFDKNMCEKKALKEIAESTNNPIPLKVDCTILSWEKSSNPENSRLNAMLLQRWNVTRKIKLFYNE